MDARSPGRQICGDIMVNPQARFKGLHYPAVPKSRCLALGWYIADFGAMRRHAQNWLESGHFKAATVSTSGLAANRGIEHVPIAGALGCGVICD